MRSEKICEFINVLMALNASTKGLTYQEICQLTENKSPRSAQRLIKTIQTALNIPILEFPDRDNYKVKRFKLPYRDLSGLVYFTQNELVEVETAIEMCRSKNHEIGAKTLQGILNKLKAVIKNQNAVETDLEYLINSKIVVFAPNIRQKIDPDTLKQLKDAILEELDVQIEYRKVHSDSSYSTDVHPYGFIYGKRNYLVASDITSGIVKHYALANIKAVIIQDSDNGIPDFDFKEHVSQSFGVFNEKPSNIVLRFAPVAKNDVMNFHFHVSQKIKELKDGSIEVSITAGGLRELCYHLFTWGESVEIVKPMKLKKLYCEMLSNVMQVYDSYKYQSESD